MFQIQQIAPQAPSCIQVVHGAKWQKALFDFQAAYSAAKSCLYADCLPGSDGCNQTCWTGEGDRTVISLFHAPDKFACCHSLTAMVPDVLLEGRSVLDP